MVVLLLITLSLQKMVVMINVCDERSKEKVIQTVASCSGEHAPIFFFFLLLM